MNYLYYRNLNLNHMNRTLSDRMAILSVWQKLVILVLICSVSLSVTDVCKININQNTTNEPILLNEKNRSYKLVYMNQCKLQMTADQTILLACPGKGNYLILTKDIWEVVKCSPPNNFLINGQIVPYSQLECNTKPKANLKITNRKCLKNSGVLIDIGFNILNTWFPIIEICHDRQKHHTYFVKHNLILPTSPCLKTSNIRPGFIEGNANLYTNINMVQIYSTKYQRELFENLIGINATNYINRDNNKFLARGHLAPDADFPIDSWITLSYFYINTAPQWQSINGGNWKSLEIKIRRLASKINRMEVFTGTHGLMKVEKKELYLYQKNVPVPDYFWKLIRNPEDNSCIGFISKNNPFLKRRPQHICQNVCSRYGWNMNDDNNNNLFSGYIYCCEHHQMNKVIEELPPSIRCKSALGFTF